MSKYRAVRTELDGITFDSKAEAKRWAVLRMFERVGDVKNLARQVTFELAPGARLAGEKRKRPPIRYVVDFVYTDDCGNVVHEDCKGMDTPVSRIKRHLMKTVHDIDVVLTK